MGHNLFVRSGRLAAAMLAACCSLLAVGVAGAGSLGPPQPDLLTPPANRVGRGDPTHHAIVGATVHVSPAQILEHATVVVRDGRILSVTAAPGPRGDGAAVAPPAPADAQVWEGEGLHVYPAFVEAYLEVDVPAPDRNKAGVHWNAKVTPQRRALEGPGVDAATARSLRGMGFATVAISPRGGIFRGQAAVVSLAEPESEAAASRPPVYAEGVYHSVALEVGGFGRGGGEGTADNSRWDGYPGSLMGAISLVRQTLIDADERWVSGAFGDNALDPLTGQHSAQPGTMQIPRSGKFELGKSVERSPAPLLFSVDDELDALRAVKIADEFKREIVLLGSGTEFRRLEPIAAARRPIILPLSFPRKPSVAGIAEAEAVELRELMTWEQAPTNPRRLADAGVTIAITTAKLRERGQFRDNLRAAIRHGLKPETALAALTTVSAQILGVADQVGTVEAGKRANLIVSDGPIFERKTKIRDMWVDGKRHEITPAPTGLEGTYELTIEPGPKTPGAIKMVIDKDNNVTIKKIPPAPPAEPPAAAGEAGEANKDAEPEIKPEAKPETKPQPGAEKQPEGDQPAPRAGATDRGERGAGRGSRGSERSRGPREQTTRGKNIVASKLGISLVFDHEPFGTPGVFTMSGVVEPKSNPKKITGDGRRADGEVFRWSAVRTGDAAAVQAGGFGGRYRITAMDGKPKAEGEPAAEITIVDERTVNVRGGADQKLLPADEVKIDSGTLTYSLDMTKFGGAGTTKVSAKREGDVLKIDMTMEDGTKHTAEATRVGDADDEDETKPTDVPEKLPGYPFGPYAMATPPTQEDIVFQHATIWTCGPAGIIRDGAIRIKDGKIVWVGEAAKLGAMEPGTKWVDLTGKHIAPGIIDCHSHTGISRGVNEGGQTVTSEVRIGDVTNPDAINWYRQLAGGTTAVNNLHGSANPIGGQNQVNKIRWGCVNPDDMHFEGAISGIKFALGENVKWGNSSSERGSWRYPQTRMGVETMIRDRFMAAREYLEQWANYGSFFQGGLAWDNAFGRAVHKLGKGHPVGNQSLPRPHRDLELEALAEILAGERLVHCHSYRQDEILMLGRIAEEFGFKIGTYQHILEGYKVAEVLRDYSGGASGFADWWAYKVEVQDAIPQGFPIMFEQGVIVSYNSDSDELARRLNVEAGKAVKYSDGSVSAEEALKFVTINPARQLHIDDRVGSLEKGKDADLVIWSTTPISSLARCEATYVDGRCLYSLEQDKAMREQNQKERQRLIQKLLADSGSRGPRAGGATGDAGAAGRPPGGGRPGGRRPPQDGDDEDAPRGRLLSRMLDDATAWRRERNLDMLRRGINPADVRGGECGCEEWMYR